MSLNDELLKRTIKDKSKVSNKNIDTSKIQLIISLGIRVILIYIFFIFFIGKYIAIALGFSNLYFISIILGTIVNAYIIFDVFKKYLKK